MRARLSLQLFEMSTDADGYSCAEAVARELEFTFHKTGQAAHVCLFAASTGATEGPLDMNEAAGLSAARLGGGERGVSCAPLLPLVSPLRLRVNPSAEATQE